MSSFFADTYALIEIIKGKPVYFEYSQGALATTEFNLYECAYAISRDYPDKALDICSQIRNHVHLYHPNDIDYLNASLIRRKMNGNGKTLSLIDALGYTIALSLKIPFLTGDREFSDIENVLFIQ
ncbi:type II toxin-antitoxin system VapC family toxin [Methanospirillum hungatei]|uniref:type II toxin-antitoxin system VapC family toxin n=1 Tax=Methanospirillum hungatei TaxID=2203 RepID=UPI0026ECE5DD|nr:PIN domain-containing protein [Methanospirillum hungatei]MCA1917029.1 PIN domain-containing protein [Methanospirillum hungatei]